MKNPNEELIWQLFLHSMDVFEQGYLFLSKQAQRKNTFAIAVKQHIITFSEFITEPEEVQYLEETIARLYLDYNVDAELEKLHNTLICIKFNTQSHLSEKYGLHEICGKYLGLIQNTTTQIKSKTTGQYETKEGGIAFRLGYPTPETSIIVSFLDLQGMDTY